MGKKYVTVTNDKRRQIVELITQQGRNITEAAKEADVYYPTAKAIYNIYIWTGRIEKKNKHKKRKFKRRKRKDPEDVSVSESSIDAEMLESAQFSEQESESEPDDEESKDDQQSQKIDVRESSEDKNIPDRRKKLKGNA